MYTFRYAYRFTLAVCSLLLSSFIPFTRRIPFDRKVFQVDSTNAGTTRNETIGDSSYFRRKAQNGPDTAWSATCD